MNPFQSALLHAFNAALLIAAAVVLLMTGHIDPSTGTAIIAAAGGLSLGVGAVSIGASSSQPTTQAGSTSNAASTAPTLVATQQRIQPQVQVVGGGGPTQQ